MKRKPQTEVTVSAIAAGAAIAMVALTWMVYGWTQPRTPDSFLKVGEVFFDDFKTSQVTQMELAAVDKSGQPLSFSVRKTNGLWTIPSHYDYPAEDIERLSRTATELIGLERKSLASIEKGAQALLGTLDPASDEGKADPENAGKSLKLTDSNGETVFHLIIGKQVEKKNGPQDSLLGLEESNDRMYYVRVPSEKETYTAKLDLDISTKFSDWIQADLLELDSAEMREIKVDNARLVEDQNGLQIRRVRVPGEILVLQKPDDFGQWQLPDLDATQEQMNAETVNSLISSIEGIQLLGVRPRYKFQGQSIIDSNFEFQFPAEVANDDNAKGQIFNDLQEDLINRGFGLARDPANDQIKLVSEHGELTTTTKDGLVYSLYFGSQMVGSEEAIQIGEGAAKAEVKEGEAKEGEAKAEDPNADPAAKQPAAPDQTTARFLLVRVSHNPDLMSDRPVAPTEPERMTVPDGVGKPATESDAATGEGSGEGPVEAVSEEKQDSSSDGAAESSTSENADGKVKSADGEPTPPVDLVSFTEQEQTPPAQEQTPPVQEETPPAQEQTPPVQEQTPPVQEQTPPVQEETPPVQEQTPPVQEQGSSPTDPATTTQDPSATDKPPTKELTREEMQKALDAEYEKQKLAFEQQKVQYELDVKDFEARTKAAQEKAKRLSERFAAWYYVVPSRELDRLRLTRPEVVKPKDLDPTNPVGVPGGLPPGVQLPEGFQLPPSQLPNE
ncbi:MAG: DUF4340 domain-containing protein [Planctomycetaceae bacterium]|nr:DUF4340 domain-containing protein [Planctomycetaceae bacterium]